MQEQNNSQIVIKNISHVYKNGVKALDNINLEIGVGLFGLLGSNGAGKSTLMRTICALMEPSEGQVTVGGHDVVTNRNEVRALLGYLPQEFGAWRLQSVADVLDILGSLSGLNDKKKRSKKIEEVLESVGLSQVAKRKVKELSGGMLRRLGVAQALIHDPKILILDEPSVGLDPEERQRFRQLMTDLAKQRTIVLSTHIISDLGSTCSDIALIHAGKVEFRGTPNSLIASARGKVFELALSSKSALKLEHSEDIEIVSRSFHEGQSSLRLVVKNGPPPENAQVADNVTLEEAYLAFTLNQGEDKLNQSNVKEHLE